MSLYTDTIIIYCIANIVNIYNGVTSLWSVSFLSEKRVDLAATSLPKHGLAFFAGGLSDGASNAYTWKHTLFFIFHKFVFNVTTLRRFYLSSLY